MSVTVENITALQSQVAALTTTVGTNSAGADEMWHLIAGALVFFMQAGFAMLEAGSVSHKNAINILFKNLMDACIAAISFWALGYGFAYGNTAGSFIGGSLFFLQDAQFTAQADTSSLNFHTWFFQFAFAATAATIVSGSVAERCKLDAYFIFSMVITTFIYPVVVCWGWGDGWLSPFKSDHSAYILGGTASNNMIDFAGSGIVHMVGGFSGLMAAILLGARKGRFVGGKTVDMPGHNMPLAALGTIILWVGWYGFNAGSTLAVSGGAAKLASKVAATTTLSAAAAGLTATFVNKGLTGTYDIGMCCNGILAGLVAITAPCAVVEPIWAVVIGIIGGLVYIASSMGLKYFEIDDPLDASPIHGFCGAWGVLAAGIFGTDENAKIAGYAASAAGLKPLGSGQQFGVQVIGVIAIAAWTIVMSGILFKVIDLTIGLRVAEDEEDGGLDASEHGAAAYIMEFPGSGDAAPEAAEVAPKAAEEQA